MGGSSYSSTVFSKRTATAKASGASFFAHTAAIKAGSVDAVVHAKLDPSKKNKAGNIVRESLDCDAHPVSNAIAVLFDVTGSMSEVPKQFVEKFPALMSLLVKKGYVSDPHVLFGAIGDAYSDQVPLQVGQFESGNEMDDALANIFLEANGGGQQTESYELAMYFMARHAKMDCIEKRGKKGYLFLSGDELPYKKVNKDQVERIIGDKIEADIPLDQILAELREKFEVFWIFPGGTMYWNDPRINAALSQLFGQNLLKLKNPDDVCELISTTIGICEGYDVKSIEADLIAAGSSKSSVNAASTALAPYIAKSGALARKTASVVGALVPAGADDVQRI